MAENQMPHSNCVDEIVLRFFDPRNYTSIIISTRISLVNLHKHAAHTKGHPCFAIDAKHPLIKAMNDQALGSLNTLNRNNL